MRLKVFACVMAASGCFVLLAEEPRTERQQLEAELSKIKTSLKDLKELAQKEDEVVAAQAQLDAAFSNYYQTLRGTMKRLDPKKASVVDREIEIRKRLKAGGFRKTQTAKATKAGS